MDARSVIPCGYLNRILDAECARCDAPRWDTPDGQLRHRVAAILQVRRRMP